MNETQQILLYVYVLLIKENSFKCLISVVSYNNTVVMFFADTVVIRENIRISQSYHIKNLFELKEIKFLM